MKTTTTTATITLDAEDLAMSAGLCDVAHTYPGEARLEKSFGLWTVRLIDDPERAVPELTPETDAEARVLVQTIMDVHGELYFGWEDDMPDAWRAHMDRLRAFVEALA